MLILPPYTKFVVWAAFLLSGICLLLLYVLPTGQKRSHLPPSPQEAVQLTGTVKDFGSNRNGDIDRLLISNAEGDTWVRFPPHTAKEIVRIATKGRSVTLWVSNGPPPGPADNESPLYTLQQLQTGDAILPVKDIPPPPPATGKPVETNGTVDSLITGPNGEISGLVVNGYRIVLPPHLAHSLAPLLRQGKPVAIMGYERSNEGFVNTSQRTLVKPYRLTIDSTDYLL